MALTTASPRQPIIQLKDVKDFGAIAAEDDDLKRFFVQTPVYDQLVSGDRQIVVGRKGSGKTALYLAMIDRGDETTFFARGLAFSDYPWALHSRYSHEATSRHERFLASWRFLAYLEIFKALLTENARGERYRGNTQALNALREVEAFIRENWGLIAFDYKKTFPSGGFKLSGLSVEPQVGGFGLGGVELSRSGSGLGQTLDRLNDWLSHALAAVAVKAPPVYVLFDELDSGFAPSSTDYIDRVVGLLLAVRAMSREFKQMNAHFHPVAFLRSDIYDSLHFGDKNKVTEANVVVLSWNSDLDYHESSLKQLLDHRIREALSLPEGIRDPWRYAFDDDVMRGTQHKFHHMAFRTYLRPRDIIKFSNCALDQYKQRMTRASNGAVKISNADVINARRVYSRYLQSELDDEIAASCPVWNDYLEVLREIKVTRFKMDAFRESHARISQRVELDRSPEDLLAFFYQYSIVGFERATGAAGLEHHFRYLDETVRFNPDARSYMVHRGLKEALELRDIGEPVEEI